ncbi:MAG: protein-glutamine gamma-glutamyltransferase [Frankiaceae bacterium]|nr:protein-glutamine gamma-glutamyltransferase [Frankiaceae bacterium]
MTQIGRPGRTSGPASVTGGTHSPLHLARRAGVVALACATLSLAMSGKLNWAVALISVVVTAGAVESLPRRDLALDKPIRYITTTIALLASIGAAVSVLKSAGSGDPTQVVMPLRNTLPLALVVIGACHAATWRRLRDVQSGLVVGFGLIAMAAVFAASVPAGIVAVAGGPAILVGVRHTRWQRVSDEGAIAAVTSGQSAPRSAGRTARRPGIAATVAAVSAALLLSLLLPFSAGTAALNRWSASHGLVNNSIGGQTGNGSSGAPATRAGGVGSYTGGPLDLRTRGDLPTTPILSVDDPGGYRLWRASIYSQYTDSSIWLPAVNTHAVNLPATGDVTSAAAPVATFVAHRLASRDTSVYAPGDIKTLDAAGDPLAYDNGNGTMSLAPGVPSYTVSASVVPTIREATAPLGRSPDASAWTQLPSTLPKRVRDLAVSLAGTATDPRVIARSIEVYLRTNESYTLDSRVPGRGEDAVDAFLFRDHLGFCEQFASAETILLRAAQVPSRLVTGLADGQDNGQGGRVFLASDLHAWVEFWVPGTGWVSSDPTAGAPLVSDTSWSHRFKKALDKLLAAIPFGRLGLVAILLAVALLVTFFVLRRRHRVVPVPAAGLAVAYGPAAEAYRRLQRRLAANGQARLPQETVRDHAARLGADPALTEALAVVEHEVFAATAPPVERSTQAAAYLDARSPTLTAPRRRSPRRGNG